MNDRIEISSIIRKRTLGLTLVLGAASFAFAQQKVNVSGKIVDKQNQAVPYASVTFGNKANKQFSDATLTDEKGGFEIGLVPGNYDVTIEAIGYKKITSNRQISNAGNLGNLTVESESSGPLSKTQDIQGVTIVATTKPVKVEIDKKTYDVKSDLTAIGGNLQDVLQNVPSVSVDPDGTVSMRGSSNVKFLVNGKPSALLGIDDGANALQSIPADQIDRIEVITNPSAKFDASGTAGILNIILKKTTKMGFNGSVVGTLGYLPRTSLNTNLSWKKGNLTWFLNGGGGYTESKGKNWTDAVYSVYPNYPDANGTQFLQRGYQSTESKNFFKNYNGSAGMVYDLNANNSVNASVTLRRFESESNSPVTYTDYLTDNTIATGYRNSTGNNSNNGIQGDFGFDHKFDDKGQNLSFSLSLQRNDSDSQSLIDQNYRQKSLQDKLNQNTLSKSLVGKIDYELPIGEQSMFNVGYKIDANKNDYSFNVLRNIGDGFSTIGVEPYNNNTNYSELINAAYIQFKSKINNFGYQVGLRDELSNITINYQNLSGTDNINDKKKNYNNLFPSVFLSYDLGKNNQFLLNYSRRISRPRSWFLVPYMSFNDSQNIFKGNADLNPSYIDSFELGYNLSKKKFTLNPVVYFKRENDDVKMALAFVNGTFITQPMNLGVDQRIGLDLNYSYDPFSWWKIMGEFDLYQYKTTGDYYYSSEDPNDPNQTIQNHVSFDGKGNSARIRMSNTFKIDKTFNIQLQGNYRAAQIEGANDNKAMYFVNLGATKTIWKGDGTIAFNIQDIFNTRSRNVIQTGNGFTRESFMQWSPRQFSLSLTYRFKQGEKVDQPKRKKDINANDQGGEDQGPPM
ncbi:TonB-dependent receptor domain-containing protein [Chryseobacterium koreense]|uniref:TonB-dependent receptor n=1 Tax=Chryseobacterium koreense CCUG 49689 TaxID=1304281 RepID=A0A0J7LS97_9FLAO|nr:TonB-dependent receptor [Chryseobacterium koreense]KMQ71860.1 TonB-dependent receptor [Chryseobacterium koreense CCUG 49689]MBB5334183.1 outer membrane receptor protein involved in Fe transport [Chryseobacterium koreense]